MSERRAFLKKVSAGATAALYALSARSLAAAPPTAAPPTAAPVTPPAPSRPRAEPPPAAGNVLDPSYVDTRLDSRSLSFENQNGARGAGGKMGNGRKGHAFHILKPGEKNVIADLQGPGSLRHIWMTLGPWRPEVMRALRLEVFYDGMSEPSISVPILDFFGLPHGRMAEYYSALVSVNEGRGLNSYIPMPFARAIRVEFSNESDKHVTLYYQIDYTLGALPAERMSYLHASFRRDNPTRLREDFVIADGLRGPGRFLGCSVGIRVFEKSSWYGEGEVKIFRDGDTQYPSYCGTGLEDYVGSAYGLGRHYAPYAGVPINVPVASPDADMSGATMPDFVSFYRWHLPDPVMFAKELRVTIQQIGSGLYLQGQEEQLKTLRAQYPDSSLGWMTGIAPGVLGFGFYERVDDYCATGFVYCQTPQPVPRYETAVATRDIALLPTEASDKKFKYTDLLDPFNAEMIRRWGDQV